MSDDESVYFGREYIESHRFGASARLAEQAVHCLELVAALAKEGLDFQFKGGNSLLLILDHPRRFSIDVDIATNEPRERIENCLDLICKPDKRFLRWTLRPHKTKPRLPMASFYIFHKSYYVNEDDAFVMLDVQLRRSPYATECKQVVSGDIYRSKTKTEIPLPSSIIGDKLLTLGPCTLGIPVGKGKAAQRLKHVYDVSMLLDMKPDLTEIRKAFFACLEMENTIQEKNISADDLLTDTLGFLICAAKIKFPSDVNLQDVPSVTRETVEGLVPFSEHLFEKGYSWDSLQRDAARAAACMAAVCAPGVGNRDLHDVLAKARYRSFGALPGIPELNCAPESMLLWDAIRKWIPGLHG
jgi:hypothetical protein